MSIEIITDSTCDINVQDRRNLNIHVIPLQVVFEDGVYSDGVDIDCTTFYEKQAQATTLPTTTLVSPAEFTNAYEPLLENGNEVVGIFLSSKLSGTLQSAQIGASLTNAPERMHVVDSLAVTAGLGLLVRIAVSMRDNGATAQEIVTTIEELRHQVSFISFVKTLKYLKMGGRISATTAAVGTLLGISPVIAMIDGEAKAVAKVKGHHKILEYTFAQVAKHPVNQAYPVCFAHSCCPDMVATYQEHCIQELNLTNTTLDELGAILGTHAGPGCYGMAYITTE